MDHCFTPAVGFHSILECGLEGLLLHCLPSLKQLLRMRLVNKQLASSVLQMRYFRLFLQGRSRYQEDATELVYSNMMDAFQHEVVLPESEAIKRFLYVAINYQKYCRFFLSALRGSKLLLDETYEIGGDRSTRVLGTLSGGDHLAVQVVDGMRYDSTMMLWVELVDPVLNTLLGCFVKTLLREGAITIDIISLYAAIVHHLYKKPLSETWISKVREALKHAEFSKLSFSVCGIDICDLRNQLGIYRIGNCTAHVIYTFLTSVLWKELESSDLYRDKKDLLLKVVHSCSQKVLDLKRVI